MEFNGSPERGGRGTSTPHRSRSSDSEQGNDNVKRRRVSSTSLAVDEEPAPTETNNAPVPPPIKYRGTTFRKAKKMWAAQIRYQGKVVDLGAYESDKEAARAYDKAVICLRGVNSPDLNFSSAEYSDELARLQSISFEDLVTDLRNARRDRTQTSKFIGVRYNKASRQWEAYIRVVGKFLSLGIYKDETAAAQAYDQAAIIRQAQGVRAVGKGTTTASQIATNFPLDQYRNSDIVVIDSKYVESILTLCNEHNDALNSLRQTASNNSAPINNSVQTQQNIFETSLASVLQLAQAQLQSRLGGPQQTLPSIPGQNSS